MSRNKIFLQGYKNIYPPPYTEIRWPPPPGQARPRPPLSSLFPPNSRRSHLRASAWQGLCVSVSRFHVQVTIFPLLFARLRPNSLSCPGCRPYWENGKCLKIDSGDGSIKDCVGVRMEIEHSHHLFGQDFTIMSSESLLNISW